VIWREVTVTVGSDEVNVKVFALEAKRLSGTERLLEPRGMVWLVVLFVAELVTEIVDAR